MVNNNLKYRSVKFVSANPEVKDVDIVRALMVQCDVDDIERVHPMPGNYWVVVFSTTELAEEATNGFILKEEKVYPKLIGQRFITATVAFAPPIASLGDIERALEPFVEVISIKDLFIRDFPGIRNGKKRVVLKPREGRLPSFFQVGQYKASLFFTGQVSCCPYCEETTHLGRDCPRKHERRCRVADLATTRAPAWTDISVTKTTNGKHNNLTNTWKTTMNKRDSIEINGEQATERDSTPSVSVDMAGVEKLSDSKASDDSVDTLVEVPQDTNSTKADTPPATDSTLTATSQTTPAIVTVNKETAGVLAGLFILERPTRAELDQQRQETQDEHTQVLFTDTETTLKDTQDTETTPKDTQEEMDIQQNLKRKPLAKVDLRQKFGQSPKPRSPKHKRRKEKVEIFTSAVSLFVLLILFRFPPPITFRSLRVASVNVRGLKNNLKRLALFHKLKSIRYDVIYLQETHTTLQEESLYTSEWSGSSLLRRDFQTSYKRRAQGHARSKYHHRYRERGESTPHPG